MAQKTDSLFVCRSLAQIMDKTFVFPNGITKIDCTKSISSLAFLHGRIPNTVEQIIVDDNILEEIPTNIKRFSEAKLFQTQYPYIAVIGNKTKKTLLDIFASIKPSNEKLDFESHIKPRVINIAFDTKKEKQEPVIQPKENVEVAPVAKEKETADIMKIQQTFDIQRKQYPAQTEDLYNINEVFGICKNNPGIKSFSLSETELEQMVRKYFKTFDRQIRFNQKTNSNLSCISKTNIPELINKIIAALKKSKRRDEPEVKPVIKTVVKKDKEPTKEKADKKIIVNKPLLPIPLTIKKYIPKKLWKDICNASGKNSVVLKNFLDNIAAVNTDVNETASSYNLQIIDVQNETKTVSSYLKREQPNCVVQSMGNSLVKDNKRIVWSYLPAEKILVCTAVFTEHTKTKNGNNYSKVRDFASTNMDAKGKPITFKRIMEEDFLDVDDLLKQHLEDFLQEEQTPVKKTYSKPVVTVTEKSVSTKKAYVKPQMKASVQKEEDIIKIETPKNLAELRAVETQINTTIDLITKTINENLMAIAKEEDIAKQLEQLDLVREAIVEKAKIQALGQNFSQIEHIFEKFKINQR